MRNISQLLLVLLSISVIGCVTKRSYSNMNNGLVIKDLIEGKLPNGVVDLNRGY